MTHDWIINVLTDLRSFSQRNGLDALAERLDDTIRVAETEIAGRKADGDEDAGPHEGEASRARAGPGDADDDDGAGGAGRLH